jgi:scaffold protein (connect acetoacetyl-CoA thiolase and HMG-CoA synthase)
MSEASTGRVPIRDDLFVESAGDGRPKLVGSRCRETGEVFFPREVMSPTLMRPGTLEDYPFDGGGTLIAWTTIQRGLSGFDSPYVLATIKLDAGPGFIGQLHDWQGMELEPGMRVELVIARIKREKDRTEVIGPKFKPRA